MWCKSQISTYVDRVPKTSISGASLVASSSRMAWYFSCSTFRKTQLSVHISRDKQGTSNKKNPIEGTSNMTDFEAPLL